VERVGTGRRLTPSRSQTSRRDAS